MQIYTIVFPIQDVIQLGAFLINQLDKSILYYNVSYDAPSTTITVQTKESTWNQSTQDILSNLIRVFYPDPPPLSFSNVSLLDPAVASQSLYGYFPSAVSSDGDAVISTDTYLTRNMYYNSLVINAGSTLYTMGWRVIVTNTLTLYGTISHDGQSANGNIQGIATSPPYTTYLGPGTSGAPGLSSSGNGLAGGPSTYYCGGASGASGGVAGTYIGGVGGSFKPISPADGGLKILSMMPHAIMGRLPCDQPYLMSSTGGGSGACVKGTVTSVKSGGGGAGGGTILVAAKQWIGNGKVSCRGGNGGNGMFSGTGSGAQAAGGGAGSGGLVILISNYNFPTTISVDVSGGIGGIGVGGAANGGAGSAGNVFMLVI